MELLSRARSRVRSAPKNPVLIRTAVLMADITPGASGTSFNTDAMFATDGLLFFHVNDGVHGGGCGARTERQPAPC